MGYFRFFVGRLADRNIVEELSQNQVTKVRLRTNFCTQEDDEYRCHICWSPFTAKSSAIRHLKLVQIKSRGDHSSSPPEKGLQRLRNVVVFLAF